MIENEREALRVAAWLEQGVVDMAVDAMVMIHRGTIEPFGASPGTPVLTGLHRSSGRVSVGSPSSFVPEKDASFYRPQGEQEALAALSGARPGDDLWWTSNAPVPALLEEGFSPKAPDGFLGLSVEEARRRIEAMEYDG